MPPKKTLRELIDSYKIISVKITEAIDKLDRDTLSEVSQLREMEKQQKQLKTDIYDNLDNGVKVISENWSFNKGMPIVRKTPDTFKIKDLETMKNNYGLYYQDEFGDYNKVVFSLFKETTTAPRLTITQKKEKENET